MKKYFSQFILVLSSRLLGLFTCCRAACREIFLKLGKFSMRLIVKCFTITLQFTLLRLNWKIFPLRCRNFSELPFFSDIGVALSWASVRIGEKFFCDEILAGVCQVNMGNLVWYFYGLAAFQLVGFIFTLVTLTDYFHWRTHGKGYPFKEKMEALVGYCCLGSTMNRNDWRKNWNFKKILVVFKTLLTTWLIASIVRSISG